MPNDKLSELPEQDRNALINKGPDNYLAIYYTAWVEHEKPKITPPKEKPTQPNRQIPEYPGKVKEKPTRPNPNIPEIKPPKQK